MHKIGKLDQKLMKKRNLAQIVRPQQQVNFLLTILEGDRIKITPKSNEKVENSSKAAYNSPFLSTQKLGQEIEQ
jgi:hypothetical protein